VVFQPSRGGQTTGVKALIRGGVTNSPKNVLNPKEGNKQKGGKINPKATVRKLERRPHKGIQNENAASTLKNDASLLRGMNHETQKK